MMVSRLSIGLALWACTAAMADDFGDCMDNFYQSTPNLPQKFLAKTQALCMTDFAILYSGKSKTPLWTAHRLDIARVNGASGMVRKDSFRAEERLPVAWRANLSDYKSSGYDRGHMVPNGDMANERAQFDSFSLANIVPQVGEQNRGVWRRIEATTRTLARQNGELYVVTGALYLHKKIDKIGAGVLVPTHLYKAVYAPSGDTVGVFFAPNDVSGEWQALSLDEFSQIAGLDPMPSVPKSARMHANLPQKLIEREHSTKPSAPKPNQDMAWWQKIIYILTLLFK